MVEPERIRSLNGNAEFIGDFVLYWMQQSQRVHFNQALEFAAAEADRRHKPLLVCFAINESYPSANLRHFAFMLEGLEEAAATLAARGLKLLILRGDIDRKLVSLSRRAVLTVCDGGYTRHQKEWRARLAQRLNCPLVQVESDVLVPVELVSPKEEFAAYTIRPKIARLLTSFMRGVQQMELQNSSLNLETEFDDENVAPLQVLASLSVDRSVMPSLHYKGGRSEALSRLRKFIESKLPDYDRLRNDPNCDCISGLSPYLHFGQISPLEIALEVAADGHPASEKFLDELIVRRELAINFVHYNANYDNIACLPDWAALTLAQHACDRREFSYSRIEFEQADTHDPYWNAAQKEMIATGKMHSYMRMYWGKKIIEWSASPAVAFETAVYLNDKYELDGRDPNAYAGIAWCFGKHDRAWPERPVFGKVRFMNAAGLRRKFNADAYVASVDEKWREYDK